MTHQYLLGIPVESWIFLLAVLAVLFVISIRVRKYATYLKEQKLRGLGLTLIVLGVILFAFVYLGLSESLGMGDTAQLTNMSMLFLVGGIGLILIDWVLQKLTKKKLLELEEDRRDWITRVRKGLKLEDAERIAKELIKKQRRRKDIQVIASEKEFKNWVIYLKDGDDTKYKVVMDIEGEVKNWEEIDQLPDYLGSPF